MKPSPAYSEINWISIEAFIAQQRLPEREFSSNWKGGSKKPMKELPPELATLVNDGQVRTYERCEACGRRVKCVDGRFLSHRKVAGGIGEWCVLT